MNADIKNRWVKALRSGQYEQTQGTLRNYQGFCCLGVLCDIMEPEGWDREVDEHWGCADMPDESLLIKAGLMEPIPLTNYVPTELSEMNDKGKSFAEIADWIEARL